MGTSLTCSVTMNSNMSVTAAFNLKTYTITANADANGSISPQGMVNVNYGGSQNFSINPNAGYQVADVKVNGISVGAVTSYGFANVTSNQTIQASFSALGSYTVLILTRTGTGVGSVSTSPTGTSFRAGTTVTLTAVPDVSSIFTGWSGECSGDIADLYYHDELQQIGHRKLHPKEGYHYRYCREEWVYHSIWIHRRELRVSKNFTITPARGYKIIEVKVDGISIGTPNNYSFGNVMADHTINASFSRKRTK